MDGDAGKWIEGVYVRGVGADAGRSGVAKNILGSVASVHKYAGGVVSWAVPRDIGRVQGPCFKSGACLDPCRLLQFSL